MHAELCLAWLAGMSSLKQQDIRNCSALSHYFKIFCGYSAQTFHSYLLSLGWTPAAQHSSVIWLTKINCRNCVPRDASCPESHCQLHDSCTAVSFTVSETAVSRDSHLTVTNLRGIFCQAAIPRAESSMLLYVYQPRTALQLSEHLCFAFRDLTGHPSVLSFSSSNEAFQFAMGYVERIFKASHMCTFNLS